MIILLLHNAAQEVHVRVLVLYSAVSHLRRESGLADMALE